MNIKECAYNCHNTDFIGITNKSCHLFPIEDMPKSKYTGITFVDCESIPIIKCPYKIFNYGLIDRQELNMRIKEIIKHD